MPVSHGLALVDDISSESFHSSIQLLRAGTNFHMRLVLDAWLKLLEIYN
jgi:hypothetical protein